MSSSSSSTTDAQISQINFPGGFPQSHDLVPSIVFLVIYILLTPVLVWRLISPAHRGLILIRPAIFLLARLGALVLRAVMSRNSYGEGELIAELILVSIGYLFLIEPCIEMWRRHIATAAPKDEAPTWVNRLSWILKYALLAAIGTAAAGAGQVSGALNDPDTMSTVKSLRDASSALTFAVAVIALFALLLTHVHFGLDARRTAYLVPMDIGLIIISVYRLIQTFSKNSTDTIRNAACFWVLQMTVELLVFAGLLSISIPAWFPKPAPREDDEEKGLKGLVQKRFGGSL